MIEEIRIENLGVIAEAHLELAPTLTVITGETGAGKTMVLTGLSLLLGGRADPSTVRRGAARAVVEGVVVDPVADVVARVRDAGADLDDGALLVSRTVPADGRARAILGGRSVPQAVLAEIAADLVTVHGQADQLRLRAPAHQRAALDAFAGAGSLVARYREAWADRARALADLEAWDVETNVRDREEAELAAGLAAIDAVAPQVGEDAALREEADRLGHVEELREACGSAHAALTGETYASPSGGSASADAAGAVEQARRALDRAAHLDPALAGWAQRLEEVAFLVSDVAVEMASHLADLEADPARLRAVHERRAVLADLVRRYAPGGPGRPGGIDGVLVWADHARRRLGELTDPAFTRDRLARRAAECDGTVARLAGELSAARSAAAAALGSAVDAELAGLAMAGAHLAVTLVPLSEPGPAGAEDVEFRLMAHPGAPVTPLSRGASGGELSRVMLALEVALATAPGSGPLPTFVFDEVDSGVGGRAAGEVGRRLAALARIAQVVVVTHLAQVAAYADRHLVVTKSTRNGEEVVTESGVRAVEGAERVRELARMLSGEEDSEAARRHAAELLERAGMGPWQGHETSLV